MEQLKLNGIYRLENNMSLVSNKTLSDIVTYVNRQTDVINELQSILAEFETSLDATDRAVKANADNIKTIAQALEGVYKNEV